MSTATQTATSHPEVLPRSIRLAATNVPAGYT